MRKIWIIGLVALAGCITPSGRVGTKVLEKHVIKSATENPTPENQSAARLATGLSRQVGAPAEAPEPTAENMSAIADQMEVEEQTWESVKGFFSGLLSKIPWGETVAGLIALISGIVAVLKGKKTAQAISALTTSVATANEVKHIAEGVISGDSKSKLEDAVAKIKSMGTTVSLIHSVYTDIKNAVKKD